MMWITLSDSNHSWTAATSRSVILESRSRLRKTSTWGSREGKNLQFIGKILEALMMGHLQQECASSAQEAPHRWHAGGAQG